MPGDNLNIDKELHLLIAKGDENAFRQLFDHYRQKIYSLSMHLTHSEFLAEEIVQEVFLKVWVNREQLGSIDYFGAYLKTIARNVASNYLKRMATERLVLQNTAYKSGESELSTLNTVAFREYSQILEMAIRELPPQQRTAYLLSRQEGLKYNEIADRMGISLHTVKEYIKKALHFIRTYLDARLELLVIAAVGTILC